MIEETVLNYLKDRLSVPVYMEAPEQMPTAYVLVEKTGSGRTNRLNRATFALQSYADSLYSAANLNEAVKVCMNEAAEQLDEVSRSALNSDYNFTDPNNKKYRYQAVYDLVHY